MMKIIALLIGLGVFLICIFGALIYPIWMIVHCANSERSGGKKAAWIIFMILIWPIVSLFYGLLASGRRFFQWISILYLFGGIAFVVIAVLGIQWSSKAITQHVSYSIAQIDQMKTDGLTPDNIEELKKDMNILLSEGPTISFSGICRLKNTKTSLYILELFDIYSQDNRITPIEYTDLINKFQSRDLLDVAALQKKIRSLRGVKVVQ